jgi:Icc-related predicted phosphoesterase
MRNGMEASEGHLNLQDEPDPLRLATVGDVHCRDSNRDQILSAFASLEGNADLLLLAGDLTSHGTPEEAAILAEAVDGIGFPVFAVLGNHDWHADRAGEMTAVLQEAGVRVLEREVATCVIGGLDVGVVGMKGFIGGFSPENLPDFGEPLLREVYGETTADVEALDAGLREIDTSAIRLVLLHYAPCQATLEGEPPGIHVFLGSERLAAPIREHRPDAVFHGHAHSGTLEGSIADVPVYNVSVPVIKRDFHQMEILPQSGRGGPIR